MKVLDSRSGIEGVMVSRRGQLDNNRGKERQKTITV